MWCYWHVCFHKLQSSDGYIEVVAVVVVVVVVAVAVLAVVVVVVGVVEIIIIIIIVVVVVVVVVVVEMTVGYCLNKFGSNLNYILVVVNLVVAYLF